MSFSGSQRPWGCLPASSRLSLPGRGLRKGLGQTEWLPFPREGDPAFLFKVNPAVFVFLRPPNRCLAGGEAATDLVVSDRAPAALGGCFFSPKSCPKKSDYWGGGRLARALDGGAGGGSGLAAWLINGALFPPPPHTHASVSRWERGV